MQVSEKTTIHQLLEAYPYLRPWLTSYAPEFAKLDNPILYNTVARAATLETAATMAETPLDRLLDDVRTRIATHEIVSEENAGSGAVTDPEARAQQQETLKRIIRKLHDGADVADVKAEFDALAQHVDSAQIAAMEQSLIAEGMPVEDVQRLCDVHVSVFKEALESPADAGAPQIDEGHPVRAYQRENVAISAIAAELRESLETLSHGDGAMAEIVAGLERLRGVELHYTRKENQLFPVLEAHDVEGPTKVMWALDDDIRGRLKTIAAIAAAGDKASLAGTLDETLTMIEDMVYKEEKILFPTALQVVTDSEWAVMAAGDAEIGFAYDAGPAGTAPAVAATGPSAEGGPMLLPLPTGALSLEQLDVMFRALPFDVSFVDENDRVRFYSEGERVFPRSPGAIGRDVHNCHPPASVHKVIEILDSFKAGQKDVAEFWIEMGERFIHIRYFAMRDSGGEYRGCLEVVQDATHVRSLQGQRRIVEW